MLQHHPSDRPHAPTATIAQRRRQHRRQNSTPSGPEPARDPHTKPPPPTTSTVRPSNSNHRRGLSLDTRRQHIRHRSAASIDAGEGVGLGVGVGVGRAFAPVGMSANAGLTGRSQQHDALRAQQQQQQQQCLQAGPAAQLPQFTFPAAGAHGRQHSSGNGADMGGASDGAYYYSQGNTHEAGFEQGFDGPTIPWEQYLAMQKTRASFANAMASADEMYGSGTALSTPTYMEFPEGVGMSPGWNSEAETASTRKGATRRISNGIADRISKFEGLSDDSQRTVAAPNQNANGERTPSPGEDVLGVNWVADCFSTRQMETGVKQEEQRPTRFSEGYDESMEETIKPNRRSSPRGLTVFDEMRMQAEQPQAQPQPQIQPQPQPQRHQPIAPAPAPAPQRANTMPSSYEGMPVQGGVDLMDLNNYGAEFMKVRDFPGVDHELDLGSRSRSHSQAQPQSPFDSLTGLHPQDSPSEPTSPQRRGHHRRTDSLASLASAASISSIDIEQTRTQTGITHDDIATYIQGPDPSDNKWACLFPECGKRFGRKENIKSHVQTHLNDRQYQCPSCHKCFVRQHDLKRHAKIHTGVKPYPCECGNSFARHDALTRHRQRGMCVGAFDGVVRKLAKRGRPRKQRPEMEDRVEKAGRTRRKNLSISSTSSFASTVSAGSGPAFSDGDSNPASPHDGGYPGVLGPEFNLIDVSINEATLSGVAPVLGGLRGAHFQAPNFQEPNLQNYANSPESPSHSYVSPGAIMDPHSLPSHPTSPAKSTTSHYAEPPELSQSSSPPSCRLFDSDPSSSAEDPARAPSFAPRGQAQSLPPGLMVGAEPDEELMKAFTHDDGMLQIGDGAGMFAGSKFEEDFAVSMMGSDENAFWGVN